MKLSLLFAAYAAAAVPFLKGPDCPEAYSAKNGWCFHKDSTFTLQTQNAFTTTYALKDGELSPIDVHHIVISVFATHPTSGKKLLVPGLPVEIAPAESDQTIYAINAQGEIAPKRIPAFARHPLITNNDGQASFSIELSRPERELRLQKMRMRAAFMDQDEWKMLRGDTAALASLASVTGHQLRELNPEMDDELANTTAEGIASLISLPMENSNRRFVDPVDRSIELFEAEGDFNFDAGLDAEADFNAEAGFDADESLDLAVSERRSGRDVVNKDWEDIKAKVIKTIQIVREGGNKIVKAIVETAAGVYHFVVATIKTAVQVVVELLKLVALSLKLVLDAVKFVIRWDEVLNTQVALNSLILYTKEQTVPYMKTHREKVVRNIEMFKGNLNQKISAIIQSIKNEPDYNKEIPAAAVNNSAAYSFVPNLITSNSDKIEIVESAKGKQEVLEQLDQIDQDTQDLPDLNQQVQHVKKGITLKGVGIAMVSASLVLLRGVVDVISDIIKVSTDAGLRLLTAATMLFWILITFEVKIPFVSALYKEVISNGRYELSLMSLATLPPAIVYTYGYMLTHLGSAPFPYVADKDVGRRPQLVDDKSIAPIDRSVDIADRSVARLKRRALVVRFGFGAVISTLISLVILLVVLDVVLAITSALIHLAWTLPLNVFILLLFFLIVFW